MKRLSSITVASAVLFASTYAHGAEVWQVPPDCPERVAVAESLLSQESDISARVGIAQTFFECGRTSDYSRIMRDLTKQVRLEIKNNPDMKSVLSKYEPLIAYTVKTRLHREGSK